MALTGYRIGTNPEELGKIKAEFEKIIKNSSRRTRACLENCFLHQLRHTLWENLAQTEVRRRATLTEFGAKYAAKWGGADVRMN